MLTSLNVVAAQQTGNYLQGPYAHDTARTQLDAWSGPTISGDTPTAGAPLSQLRGRHLVVLAGVAGPLHGVTGACAKL